MAASPITPDDTQVPYLIDLCVFEVNGKEVITPVERLDGRKLGEDALAARCGNVRDIMKVIAARGIRGKSMPHGEHAVYVIATENGRAIKIGVSNNPLNRVSSLQCGTHEQLRLTHLFWTTKKEAYGLEKLALRVMGKLGKRLKGEWSAISPDNAAMVIAILVIEAGLKVSDSSLYHRALNRCNLLSGDDFPSAAFRSNPLQILLRKDDLLPIDTGPGGC